MRPCWRQPRPRQTCAVKQGPGCPAPPFASERTRGPDTRAPRAPGCSSPTRATSGGPGSPAARARRRCCLCRTSPCAPARPVNTHARGTAHMKKAPGARGRAPPEEAADPRHPPQRQVVARGHVKVGDAQQAVRVVQVRDCAIYGRVERRDHCGPEHRRQRALRGARRRGAGRGVCRAHAPPTE